ncbi:MAG TPA: type II secretion system ATPase GspE [Thermodesulfobacteriota bacterium]|nr:type II secretion system ATPase GspE [Deltaproteobacteria bacterium]HNU70106.1 type II secretion system ATPase GspE [Thermodesulfobacteriota bacterium]HQO77008.1 type II secretion system ATPase GspE [Thermodesulfobacteriota bacterium]
MGKEYSRKLLGEILVEQGKITPENLERVLAAQKESTLRIGRHLVTMGFASEEDVLRALSLQLDLPYITAKDYPAEPVMVDSITAKFMKQNRFAPLWASNGDLSIAMHDPLDVSTIEAIMMATGLRVRVGIGKEEDILKNVEDLYGSGASSMDRIIDDIEKNGEDLVAEDAEDIEHLKDMASEAPVIRLVNLIISRAVEFGASDIHLEPFEGEFKIRYRIDGILHDVESPPRRLQAAIISRIKIMAKLNIAERRLPQDGRIKLRVMGKEVDFRVSTIPIMLGESVVMRILDRTHVILDLERLGFFPDTLATFEQLIVKPYGMILVTGPTGSGKTTTLYAALEKINSPERKIITVEDPVEYQIKGVNQIQVKPQIGLTFASGLRSIVRQDPDIILVGEIRDYETAEIAIQSALTGHLVFSTLHTNDAAGAISRLMEMGAEDYLISSCLIGLLAQRLVRVLCPHCRVPSSPEPQVLAEMGIDPSEGSDVELYEAKGCEKCANTGYRGRAGIYELIPVGDDIKSLILKKSDSGTIKRKAVANGMRTLRQDGWLKVKKGMTSVSEVLRVTLEEM